MKIIFEEEPADWTQMLCEDMAVADKDAATEAWRNAEVRPVSDGAELSEDEENNKIQERIVAFVRKELKWTHRELHDAVVVAGVAVPLIPSIRNYIAVLHAQFGHADTGFLPQSFHTHKKQTLVKILTILGRTGLKLGGTKSDRKGVIAERLASWLNTVLTAGRAVPEAASGDEDDSADDLGERPRPKKNTLARARCKCRGDPAECQCVSRASGECPGSKHGHGDRR